ncbi:MAG: ArdC family protein [Acidimicrobiaceae bacterium]|nr:ArdC family protein [Acidimicrobiaceae bacterium]
MRTEREAKPHKDVRQDLANTLITHIENGTAPWQMPWDPALGDDTPINAVTGKAYRGINQLWLGLNQPDSDPRWCTFNQARERKWQIRKGSHGTSVEK